MDERMMSEDESDWDDEGSFTWRIQPGWRDEQLTEFLNLLDGDAADLWHRIRVDVNDAAEVRQYLPLDCYSTRWLSQHPFREHFIKTATPPIHIASHIRLFGSDTSEKTSVQSPSGHT
jgi:hypothetical protein